MELEHVKETMHEYHCVTMWNTVWIVNVWERGGREKDNFDISV